VAQGNYATRIYKRSEDDELAFLVQSFNYMTLQLEQSRQSAERSQRTVERQRARLQAVLGQISSGVITLDANNNVLTSNPAAVSILGGDLMQMRGQALVHDAQDSTVLAQFYMTQLISAQRDAAWSEVARRLAHEIKNPLTPIQLSAERLRHKFGDKLEGNDVELLSRLTHTIENQVDSLKGMVNAFAEYASIPNLTLVPTSMNELLREVSELYISTPDTIKINLNLSPDVPQLSLDLPRMRQLAHNLIKNALEAQQGNRTKVVTLSTYVRHELGNDVLEITAHDEGPGFPLELLDRLFEPYVSSKPKGTGLGLAIVKRIVEEHNGRIRAENRAGGGAMIIVSLPYPSSLQLRGDAA